MSRTPLAWLLPLLSLALAPAKAEAEANTEADGDSGKSGAEFLQSMVRRMQGDRYIADAQDIGLSLADYRPTPLPTADHHYGNEVGLDARPSQEGQGGQGGQGVLPLSKGELLALYQAAVTKGAGLDLSSLPQLPLTQDTHQEYSQQHQQAADDLVNPSDQGTLPGYYYYFYPINSFMPNGTEGANNESHHDMMMMMMDNNSMADNKETRLDPLFLAMAGFVSMATIVSFSILFLPKFGDGRKAQLKTAGGGGADLDAGDDDPLALGGLTRVMGQALHGRDCTERLSCELGRAIRTMQLGPKPIRVVEALLPPQLAKQMARVRQHVVKKENCQAIGCKAQPQKPAKAANVKPAKPVKQNNKKQPKTLRN